MVNYQPCEKCKAELGIDILVDKIEKKDKSGFYFKNLDGSYHVQPFEQPNGAKTLWFHVSSKEHSEWTKTHNGPSGFIQKPQAAQTIIPSTSTVENPKEAPKHIDLKEDEKGLFNLYKQKMRGVMILEAAVRETLIETGNGNPDPRQIGLFMKLVSELG